MTVREGCLPNSCQEHELLGNIILQSEDSPENQDPCILGLTLALACSAPISKFLWHTLTQLHPTL